MFFFVEAAHADEPISDCPSVLRAAQFLAYPPLALRVSLVRHVPLHVAPVEVSGISFRTASARIASGEDEFLFSQILSDLLATCLTSIGKGIKHLRVWSTVVLADHPFWDGEVVVRDIGPVSPLAPVTMGPGH